MTRVRRLADRRVSCADERTHTCSRDAVNWNTVLLEYLEYANVGTAFGAAAGEHEADPWPPP